MADRVECVVVGAGVVGLAVARALALAGREVLLLEAETHPGTMTSARNSGVIHAGLYYTPGSFKARFCVAGNRALYAYCKERGIDHHNSGKLIVANGDEEEQVLLHLLERAHNNDVDGVRVNTGITYLTTAVRSRPNLAIRGSAEVDMVMDDLGIWRRALTDVEVAWIFISGQQGTALPTLGPRQFLSVIGDDLLYVEGSDKYAELVLTNGRRKFYDQCLGRAEASLY